jgi:hypothetical protein
LTIEPVLAEKTCAARGGDAERVLDLRRIEPEQVRRGDGRAHYADDTRRMERERPAVVARCKQHASLHLKPFRARGEDLAPAGMQHFAQSERDRQGG